MLTLCHLLGKMDLHWIHKPEKRTKQTNKHKTIQTRKKQRNRRTQKQTSKQANKRTSKQANKQTKSTSKKEQTKKGREKKQTNKQTNRQTNKQGNRQTTTNYLKSGHMSSTQHAERSVDQDQSRTNGDLITGRASNFPVKRSISRLLRPRLPSFWLRKYFQLVQEILSINSQEICDKLLTRGFSG